jgi:hypothetical protein
MRDIYIVTHVFQDSAGTLHAQIIRMSCTRPISSGPSLDLDQMNELRLLDEWSSSPKSAHNNFDRP